MGFLAVLTVLLQTFGSQQAAPPPPPPPPFPPVMREETPPCEAYWKAAAIFSGELLDVTAAPRMDGRPAFQRRATFRVDRSWRGDVGGQVDVYVVPSSEIDFERGEKYLVYTSRFFMDGTFRVAARSKTLSAAAEDLEYFERAQRPSSGATVSGSVVFEPLGNEAPRPAPGYKVRLGNTERQWTAESNAQGVFRFANVPAGKYGITVDVPEAMRLKGPTMVDIPDARACAEPAFRIASEGTVDLYVLDAKGRPALRTTLELIDVESLSDARPTAISANTSGDGSVGWGQVRPGRRYIIGLNVTRVPDPRRPLPILFYPGATDIAGAHVFEVGAGEHVQLDTFRLPEAPARLDVIGTVVRPDGTPISAADVILRSAAKLSRGHQIGARVKTNAQGRFSLPAISGYRYFVEVLLSVEGQNPKPYAISQDFELTEKTGPLKILRRPN